MVRRTLRLVVALVVVRIDDGAGAVRGCKWGSGEAAVPQPATWTNATTCTPPSIVGAGQVTLQTLTDLQADGATQTTGAATTTTELDYLDVQVYRYPHVDPAESSAYRTGNTTVALIAHGADGCTACGGSPLCTKMTPAECLNITLLDVVKAGELGVDLAVLPENWHESDGGAVTDPPPQPLSGSLITTVVALAKKYSMNIVAPIRELRDGRFYNTAVVIDRSGTIVGHYSKVFPVWGNTARTAGEVLHVTPSEEGVRVFDLDIGKMAVLICYDINFPELWHQAAALGADLIVWPSAMKTPDPSTYGYARIHRVPVVAVGYPGDVVDSTGLQLGTSAVAGHPSLKVAELDLTGVWVHWDYNTAQVQQLLKEHPTEITLQIAGPPFYLLRAAARNVSVGKLLVDYGIEPATSYIGRSRHGVNVLRQLGL